MLGTARHIEADLSERNFGRPAFHQFSADLALQFAHLHRQRRLGHRAFFRRPAEMAVFGERRQITQLAKGNHAGLSTR